MSAAGVWMVWVAYAALHPFHVSVTQMEYSAADKAVQISSKVFLDDLEDSFNAHFGTETDLWEQREDATTDSLLKVYFAEHFRIWINGRAEELTYVGKEVDLTECWFYFEVERVRKIKEMRVRYTLGFLLFEDQSNLLHMVYGEQEESLRLTPSEREATLTFDK